MVGLAQRGPYGPLKEAAGSVLIKPPLGWAFEFGDSHRREVREENIWSFHQLAHPKRVAAGCNEDYGLECIAQ